MTIFDTIRFPASDFGQTQKTWMILPVEIRSEFLKWINAYGGSAYPPEDEQVIKLREIIANYNT